jgi:hypothetical protein
MLRKIRITSWVLVFAVSLFMGVRGLVTILQTPKTRCVYATTWTGRVDSEFQTTVEKDLKAARTQKCNLSVTLTSEGGEVPAMLEIVRLMDKYEADGFVLEVHGKQLVASAGAVILAHGTPGKRFIAPGTFFLIHAVQAGRQCVDATSIPKAGDKRIVFTMFGPMEVEVDEEQAAFAKFIITGFDEAMKRTRVQARCGKAYAGPSQVAVDTGAADEIKD